ncbi:MAG: hypothetical protein HY541_01535 [Deltaproteobacteria bacterium]|nr:hypothetical protein [Deltaproteobacteria bacterium]
MTSLQQILLYLIPIVLFLWIIIGILIIRQKIHMNIDHSYRLKRGVRRLDLGKTGRSGAAGRAG